ncbi:MAG: toxin-antitoxin system subunit antitoxin [Akkermansiaceae bacterium]|nr:toxin-antitoxin system subunit antitoxin [Verrucomicrobiales bacterium]
MQRAKLLVGIEEGERASQDGRVVPHEEAKRRLAKWLK